MPSVAPKFLSREQVGKWHRFPYGKMVDEIAASYVFYIAQAQAYLDGNKRTAVAAALAFLQINGVSIDTDAFPLHEAMVAVREDCMIKPSLAKRFQDLFSDGDGQRFGLMAHGLR